MTISSYNYDIFRDLLWADPVVGLSGFQENMRGNFCTQNINQNYSGASYGFGSDVLATLCKELNIDLVARAHQVGRLLFQRCSLSLDQRCHVSVQDGYEFFGNRKLVTIFSVRSFLLSIPVYFSVQAPHYCGQFDNAAAMLIVNEELVCSFQVLKFIIDQLADVFRFCVQP